MAFNKFFVFSILTIFIATRINFCIAAASGNPDPIFVCPLPSLIAPCTCNNETRDIDCRGLNVKQDTLNRTFEALRQINNVPLPHWLNLGKFILYSTCLTTLNLTPFLGCRFEFISLNTNSLLTKIVGPPQLGNGNDLLIETPSFSIFGYYKLNDEGFGKTLHYFVPHVITSLGFSLTDLAGTQTPLADGSGDVEFLPGLAALNNLQRFSLRSNPKIVSFEGGQFKRNVKLEYVDFYDLQNLARLGKNAMLIGYDADADAENFKREIRLYTNKLNDSSFQPDSGFEKCTKFTYLWLGQSGFDFLSKNNFESYLEANSKNVVNFNVQPYEDHFVCDERMKWLKDKKADYKNRVLAVYCSNDPTPYQTIFTTTLV